MICLGIESTAHTFGAGLVEESGKILGEFRSIYRPAKGWGIKPSEARMHHLKASSHVIENLLRKSGVKMKDVDLVSFSRGPGLPPCLKVGLEVAKKIAEKNGIPIVGVNHCIAHVEMGRLVTGCRDPIVAYVSGANTQIISFVGGRYRIFGETQDIGLGNALDKFGRKVGLKFPCGPEIERLAKNGNWVKMPYTVKGMDLSFSGIVTEAIKKYETGVSVEDLCFSLQEVLFSMLTEVTERALAHLNKKEVMLTGGVASNNRLREMMGIMCRDRGARFYAVDKRYSGDNGVMIAWLGVLMKGEATRRYDEVEVKPRERTDEVEILYRPDRVEKLLQRDREQVQ